MLFVIFSFFPDNNSGSTSQVKSYLCLRITCLPSRIRTEYPHGEERSNARTIH